MKIGILLSAYNSEEYIDECLTPWFNLKEQYNITICCNRGMFKDYADYGYTSKNKTTLQKLVNFDIDFLISTGPKSRLDEITSKNTLLRILKNSCDIVWILDSDEFYTEKEIINIIDYLNCTPEYDWYSVNFRNYTFTKNLFLDGFSPPRIFRTDRNEGINEFYFDNHINYNDGEDFENKNNNTIPRDIAWIKHYTWLNEDSRSKEKIRYHIERFIGGCSFEWDENLDSLKFSESFYNSRNLEIPVLHEKIDWLSNEFTIDFARNENKFYVKNITKPQSLDFKFFDGQTGDQIYNTNLDLSPDITYFVWPTSTMFKDIDGFKKFRVEVTADKKIIHNEFIHI
jgi:hypothetical protein